jgi:glucose-6-phosphate isomerase
MISKSGTTLEPALSFRLLREELIKKEGLENANKLTIAVTDGKKGTLKEVATKNKFDTFVIPDDIGGRFSVLTPVGLVPLLFAGVDVDALMQGAIQASKELDTDDLSKNPAYQYAAARSILSKKYKIELMGGYEPNLQYFIE